MRHLTKTSKKLPATVTRSEEVGNAVVVSVFSTRPLLYRWQALFRTWMHRKVMVLGGVGVILLLAVGGYYGLHLTLSSGTHHALSLRTTCQSGATCQAAPPPTHSAGSQAATQAPAKPGGSPTRATSSKTGSTNGSNPPSGVAGNVQTASVLWDYFQRADGPLHGQTSPSGQSYITQGPVAPYIENDRYVRNPAGAAGTGGNGFSVLLMPFASAPSTVSVSFVYTAGTTSTQAAIFGACQTYLQDGSVQLWVRPTSWSFLTVTSPNSINPPSAGSSVSYNYLASGTFSVPLAVDGQTIHSASMTYDATTSSVTLTLPDGSTHTITSPEPTIGLSTNWGVRAFAQIAHPKSTDGDVAYTAFGAN